MSIVPTLTGPTGDAKPSKLSALEAKRQMESLGVWVNSEYQKCKNARSAIERQWYLNMAFYYGNQYVTPLGNIGVSSGASAKLTIPQVPPWRTRLIVNRIRPIIRTELARTTSQKPSASVIPASS